MATDDVARATRKLRMDRERGAMQLAMEAVNSAADLVAAGDAGDVRHIVRALATARPSMAAIANAVALFGNGLLADRGESEDARNDVRQYAASHIARWQADHELLRMNTERHIPDVVLAYSNSSTTRAILLSLAYRIKGVVIPEGRPIDDGKRLARTLAAAGIPVTVITEAQMGMWVPQVGAILVGADTITPDGAVINHMGTATLARLAEDAHIPVISVAHSLKMAPFHRPEDTQEANDPTEVWPDPPPGVTISNFSFDETPADRVTIITERGVLTDTLRSEVVATHRAAWLTCGISA